MVLGFCACNGHRIGPPHFFFFSPVCLCSMSIFMTWNMTRVPKLMSSLLRALSCLVHICLSFSNGLIMIVQGEGLVCFFEYHIFFFCLFHLFIFILQTKKNKKREEEKRKGHPGQWSPKRSVRARPKRANYLLNWQVQKFARALSRPSLALLFSATVSTGGWP